MTIARRRYVLALQRTCQRLQAASDHARQRDTALDLFAEELRPAHDALGEITGCSRWTIWWGHLRALLHWRRARRRSIEPSTPQGTAEDVPV